MRAAEANRILADYQAHPDDLEACRARLTIPKDCILPTSPTTCYLWLGQKLLPLGSVEQAVAKLKELGLPVLFNNGGRYYDTIEEVPWA